MSSYKCLFFHTRNCPIREQMDITDEKLSEEKIILEREYEVPSTPHAPADYVIRKHSQTIVDWIIGKVCYYCPHREA